ncbi:hypothetical protein LSH36_86g06022 [Paralvinella palmiformis]|uniref:Isopropylmalate dehydrogenase-like domain-containing protein n=1 Tax=Paralvinella palmiformis TaxID=53620 RepID=A0AAD9NCE4_9ANNE|nr:hypothetical protein LSH36_86g06022 [Paralvinella palmiformis]
MALTKVKLFIPALPGCSRRLLSNLWNPRGLTVGTTQRRNLHSSLHIKNLPRAQYGGRHTVTVMAGDGVGPELMAHLQEVFHCAGAPVDFEEVMLNHTTSDEDYENAVLAVKRNGVAIKGNVETVFDTIGVTSRNLALRAELDLFANVVCCKSVKGVETRHNNIDLVVIRENTEGEYRQLEHENVDGVIESLKIITAKGSNRIAKYAFDYAVRHGRKKVTAVHKANIMKLGDGLFLECCHQMSKNYPDVEFDSLIVDNCSMQMVSKPQQFDVILLPNLYGNIIANIGAGLVGGPGMVPGLNVGELYAVFETGTRNTGRHVAGKNLANPSAMLLAGADMLDYLGLGYHGDLIHNAVNSVLGDGKFHTPDIGGTALTTDVVSEIIRRIEYEGC